ncbi:MULTISPECIES: aldehyde dehydrogenase [unclassified Sedimentibacter]|uniref:aldehyde dehydrogenase n=1 Tax=unclassified Sedimentibacter TaxID=2649220 RepID=UPI0027E11B15|nr:aldehyde dehydrogenase [Sedimentibacter sp. MB35-C1]WMJ75930.1 aldehyde dehydrogenase [Sedimentibacter sp. MB35-C1]
MNIKNIVEHQKMFFMTGATRPVNFRTNALLELKKSIERNEHLIETALKSDLNKTPFETYMTEIGIVMEEINFHLKHINSWMKNRKVRTPLAQFHSKSFISPEPYGVVLIMSPWNYPLQLCLEPLIGAISAGNCAVIKPSAYAPETSSVINKIISETFPPEYITVVEGGREQNKSLLKEKFDYIFFTGSVSVGKIVMKAAAENLTPITLELGGKSPAIVTKDSNIKIAARRIAFGKVLNSGQTCVAPDYLLVHKNIEKQFLGEYKKAIYEFFPNNDYSNMPCIINQKHFQRLTKLVNGEKIYMGGSLDEKNLFIEPTVLTDIKPDSAIMQEEIFGPILPVITYSNIHECIGVISSRPKPLALYLFTESKEMEKTILNSCSFGGGCINDTVIHTASTYLGFGGVGNSGIGSYHGKLSFDTFTHYRSIVKKYSWLDIPIRYHPYKEKNYKLIRSLMK